MGSLVITLIRATIHHMLLIYAYFSYVKLFEPTLWFLGDITYMKYNTKDPP